jgi:2,4-dienoyl-CoA reductase-like NADH-dependent reductase (Old Yellow Enzyme family)
LSIAFTPVRIGSLTLENRFVQSATYECMATTSGEVTDDLVRRYRTLGRGDIGLIIPGHLYVASSGRAAKHQAGIHDDAMIPGLSRIVTAVHERGGKVAFQLAHAGLQTHEALVGGATRAPSRAVRSPMTFQKPRAMTEAGIHRVIDAFASAAARAAEAGADAVQLHAAHGYLLSEFLSPFFNRRRDVWGGSEENRFRLLGEVLQAVRKRLPPGTPVLVKMNGNDFTPGPGMTPELAAVYAGRLADLGVDALEVSCGTFFTFHTMRGEVPAREISRAFPRWMRPLAKVLLGRLRNPCRLVEAYNLEAARVIRPSLGGVPLILVGGLRSLPSMERILERGDAELVSLCRPLIREPLLIRRFREGRAQQPTCISCNRCFAAVATNRPVRCYRDGL